MLILTVHVNLTFFPFYFNRCLHKTGGLLQFTAPKCIKIKCCVRLHNMAINGMFPLEAADNPIQILYINAVYEEMTMMVSG